MTAVDHAVCQGKMHVSGTHRFLALTFLPAIFADLLPICTRSGHLLAVLCKTPGLSNVQGPLEGANLWSITEAGAVLTSRFMAGSLNGFELQSACALNGGVISACAGCNAFANAFVGKKAGRASIKLPIYLDLADQIRQQASLHEKQAYM